MNDALLQVFAEESQEILEALETGLMDLENSNDEELINSVFRAAHTMKGNAGLVGFDDVVNLTHLMEGLLDEVRQGRMHPDHQMVEALLVSLDTLKDMVASRIGGAGPALPQTVMDSLQALLAGTAPPPPAPAQTAAAPAPWPGAEPQNSTAYHISMKFAPDLFATGNDPLLLLLELEELGEIKKIVCHHDKLPPIAEMDPYSLYLWWEVWLDSSESIGTIKNVFLFVEDRGEIMVEAATQTTMASGPPPAQTQAPAPKAAAPAPKPAGGPAPAGLLRTPTGSPTPVEPKGGRGNGPGGKPPDTSSKPVTATPTIRVDTDKLDKLVNLVGELVIAVARVNQISSQVGSEELESATESIDHISRDLQEQVMRVRMVPVEATFNRFQRVVRDLAGELGKKIHLEMSGVETELDKNVIEQIVDPLKHLVRNSADHGLEPPQERLAAGKPESGCVFLRAYQQEGKIIIEVADDGRGINREKVLDKARERGLLTDSRPISDSEAYGFMFQPGFSTAAKVTEVSGRGVGLDVVRQNIEKLRGSVEVESTLGQGSIFRIKLPLTLAIIDGMTVRVGEEILTLPVLSIVESLRPKKEDLKTVEGEGELVTVRGEYLPLVRLHRLFGFPTDKTDPTHALIVIIESVSKRFGVLVDDIIGEQQAVIKSLEQNYQKVEGVAGATILGDGRVSLILDIHGLEKLAFAE